MSSRPSLVRESFRRGWEVISSQYLLVLGYTVVFWVISALGKYARVVPMLGRGFSLVDTIIGFVLMIMAHIGGIMVSLKFVSGKKPVVEDIYSGYPRILDFAIASLIMGVSVAVGSMFLIIPGIYLALRWMFVPFLVIDKGMGGFDALSAGWKLTKGRVWELFVFALAVVGVNILGALLLGVGLLVTLPLSALAYAQAYRLFMGSGALVSKAKKTVKKRK